MFTESLPGSSPFLSFPRELRDQIYDSLLYAPIGSLSPSVPGHLIDVSERHTVTRPKLDWKWQTHASRGSCFGILYTCRQTYTEVVECFERQQKLGGMSFELDVILVGITNPERSLWTYWTDEIWPTWIVLPLCTYPEGLNASSLISVDLNPKCKNLDVSLRLQSELTIRWSANGGLSKIVRNLFTMLARFLLYGPAGLYRNTDTNHVWSIDTLSVNLSSVESFTDPLYNNQIHTVPIEILTDSVMRLKFFLDVLCSAGALSDRVRLVRFSVEGVLENEWLIDREKTMSPTMKDDWAFYGWVIDRDVEEEMRRLHNFQPRTFEMALTRRKRWHLPWSLTSCCRVQ
ncbi:hypothetical protein FB446DRAFT_791635 [Lentinula raphanica]|uniref:Uncharacterized protein n=1 Tax=Lentinula raphanica TaxID=153919 RepID=A0AA38PE76_9AGAR|nr:hypothetical protein C8R42DRAFT_653948 [Lentinula raphanica]KAJ3769179.1 hypothetical protein FB446DRAFT_791635 [Lentinula raphanica]KAJ3827868.1 hypothetical protein F5880DRAFT_1534317 [Lentinula raphanica]KAJ3841091.1 hypothetical protein F5878DRAFT_611220 [Lentinula raphanica]